jgi:hypothetical protein
MKKRITVEMRNGDLIIYLRDFLRYEIKDGWLSMYFENREYSDTIPLVEIDNITIRECEED